VTTATWGIVLTVAALIAIGLQVRRLRAAQITTPQFAAGMVARGGFLILGILYASDLVYRWPRAPLIGLGIVGLGILLNLVVGIIENIRHTRSRYDAEDGTDG
jgi:uncharacterized protein with PQ loop repeat